MWSWIWPSDVSSEEVHFAFGWVEAPEVVFVVVFVAFDLGVDFASLCLIRFRLRSFRRSQRPLCLGGFHGDANLPFADELFE